MTVHRMIRHVYLCPGNTRAGGEVNPAYDSTCAFINDCFSLLPDVPEKCENTGDLLIAESESGIRKAICFSPRHDLTLASMTAREIAPVVDIWARETATVKKFMVGFETLALPQRDITPETASAMPRELPEV